MFQRTPSAIDIRDDMPTDPEWAAALKPGWQKERPQQKHMRGPALTEQQKRDLAALPREEKIRRQENQNIEHMMRIHARVEEIVKDKATAEALKPWYMHAASGRATTTNICRRSTCRTSIWWTPTARASPRSTRRGACSRAANIRSTC